MSDVISKLKILEFIYQFKVDNEEFLGGKGIKEELAKGITLAAIKRFEREIVNGSFDVEKEQE